MSDIYFFQTFFTLKIPSKVTKIGEIIFSLSILTFFKKEKLIFQF